MVKKTKKFFEILCTLEMMASIRKYKTPTLVFLLLFALLYNVYCYFFTAYPFNIPRNDYSADPLPMRRDLVRRIMRIQREIDVRAEKTNNVDGTWAKELLRLAAELDSRIVVEKPLSEEINKVPVYEHNDVTSSLELPRVCPEEYRGRDVDNNYRNNFVTVPCQSQSMKEVLTILIPTKGWQLQRIETIVNDIRKIYDLNIVVITYGYMAEPLKKILATVKMYSMEKTEAVAINEVIQNIKTPYTFIAHSISDFDEETNLERLVRVLEENLKVNIASGAFIDSDGLWSHGCLQTTMENYRLKYTRGYEHSHSECMYCDDVIGPFVVRTKFLQTVYLTETMEGHILYRDWFLNVRLDRKLVMTCPDVMFYIDTEETLSKKDWYLISQKWSVEKIQSFDGETYKFSCDEAQISCHNLMKTVSSFIIAPCCLETFRKELEYVQMCAEEINVHYEIIAGTLLGAVKMEGMLPWDFDSDIKVCCSDKETWMSKGYECLAKRGCKLKTVLGSYWTSTCQSSVIDLICYDNSTADVMSTYLKIPTKVNFDGLLLRSPKNPGRYVRNQYGHEYLKHAVHWRYSSNAIIPLDDGSGQAPGIWHNKCIVPTFHSCIDHFPVDGNLKFLKPYECEGSHNCS